MFEGIEDQMWMGIAIYCLGVAIMYWLLKKKKSWYKIVFWPVFLPGAILARFL